MRTSWPGTSDVFGEDAVPRLDHAVHVPFGCAGLCQDFGESVLSSDLYDDHLAAFEIVCGIVSAFRRF